MAPTISFVVFPPAFVALLCCYIVHFYQPASWETFLLQCHVRFFDFEFYLFLFFLCRQTWAVRTMASSQTFEFYTDRHPASGRPSGKIFLFFSTRLNRRRFKLVRYFTCLLFVFSILLTFKLTLAKSRLLGRCVLSILQRSLCFDLIIR